LIPPAEDPSKNPILELPMKNVDDEQMGFMTIILLCFPLMSWN